MKDLKFKIPLEIYECKLHFIVTKDVKKKLNKLRKKHKLSHIDWEMSGVSDKLSFKKYCLIISKKQLNINTISHEMFHTVNSILEDREIKDEEAKSWLCGYLTQKIFDFLKQEGIKL